MDNNWFIRSKIDNKTLCEYLGQNTAPTIWIPLVVKFSGDDFALNFQ
jgi:hypothetical protein